MPTSAVLGVLSECRQTISTLSSLTLITFHPGLVSRLGAACTPLRSIGCRLGGFLLLNGTTVISHGESRAIPQPCRRSECGDSRPHFAQPIRGSGRSGSPVHRQGAGGACSRPPPEVLRPRGSRAGACSASFPACMPDPENKGVWLVVPVSGVQPRCILLFVPVTRACVLESVGPRGVR